MGNNEIEVFGEVNGAYNSCGSLTDIVYGIGYVMGNNTQFRTALAVPTGTSVYKLRAYEDDDTRCVWKQDDDPLGNYNTGIQLYQYPQSFRTDPPFMAWISHVSRP